MNLRIHVTAIFALALALTACSSAPSDSPTSSASAPQTEDSSKSTGSPTKTANQESSSFIPASAAGPAKNVALPKLPSKARDNSQKGASAFAEYYYALVNFTIDTNDASELKKYTTRECIVCGLSIIDPADKAKKAGRWQVGGKHHPRILQSNMSGDNLAVVNVEYRADALKTYEAPNKIYSENPGLETTRVAVAVEFDNGWKVYKIAGIK